MPGAFRTGSQSILGTLIGIRYKSDIRKEEGVRLGDASTAAEGQVVPGCILFEREDCFHRPTTLTVDSWKVSGDMNQMVQFYTLTRNNGI
jgi:hypothetical protein